jgi:hypothetical protein
MGRMNFRRKRDGSGEVPEGWSQPSSATDSTPWNGPGSASAFDSSVSADPVHPFTCKICKAHLGLAGAYAHDGDIYCFECRPDGAVSSQDLPSDESLLTDGERRPPKSHLARLLRLLLFGDR